MSREGDWMCSCISCQHLNFKKRDSCHRCQCPRYGGGANMCGMNRTEVDLPGDWYCIAMNCGAHNYASRTSCHSCGAPKDCYGYSTTSTIPGWKTGDWLCPRYGCGVHNYARRTECFKCNTPRDFGGAM